MLNFFSTYADSKDLIDASGVERLCTDMGVDPCDPQWLAVAFYCGASAMGEFTREEFTRGMTALGVDSPASLHEKFPALRAEMRANKHIYYFSFDYGCDPGCRGLGYEVAISLWPMFFSDWPLLEQWTQFVEVKCRPKNHTVSKDSWRMLWDLVHNVAADLGNFDPEGAWPVMIDEFVETVRRGH